MSHTALRRSSRLLALSAVIKAETISAQTSKRKRIVKADLDLGTDDETEVQPSTKKRKKTADKELILKASKRSKLKPEPIYAIPDVQNKETTFRGRLGVDFLLFVAIGEVDDMSRLCMSQYRP